MVLSMCADFNLIKVFLTKAVPSHFQCIQVNATVYLSDTRNVCGNNVLSSQI